jgi:hypothetical protein
MKFLANPHINRLAAHSTLHQLAWCISGVFFGVFLLKAGIAPAVIFLSIAGIRVVRFALRPLVLLVIPAIGLRRTMMLATFLFALQYPALAFVDGPGPALLVFCVVTALGEGYYFTCYHALFAALGDAEHRGSQLGVRQGLAAGASVVGPVAGGLALVAFGPWAAFGVAALAEIAAVLPLRDLPELPVDRATTRDVYASAQPGVYLFLTDGWIITCSAVAWDIIMFRALGGRYDAFGGALAAAALFGAVGGFVLGRFIDISRARYAAGINAVVCSAMIVLKAVCGEDPAAVVVTASIAAMMGALYSPSLMTAVYNDAKLSACPMRFQFAAEACWDIGSAAACLAAAAACALGISLQTVILLALPAVGFQAALLRERYAAHGIRADQARAVT